MKTETLIIALAAITFTLSSCGDFDRRTQFRTSYTNRVTFDQESTASSPKETLSDKLNQSLASTVKDHGAPENSVEHVELSALSLEIDENKSGELADLDFLKHVKVFLKADGKDEIILGEIEEVPQGGFTYVEMSLMTFGVNFKEYLETDKFQCRLEYTTDQEIPEQLVVKISAIYKVDTKRFGI